MKKLHLISLGCNKNLVDSEVMLGKLAAYTLTNEPKEADVIIVNTCGFIESAKQESVEKIMEVALNKKRGGILVVSGCLSARYKEELKSEIPEIDIITGVGDYDKIDLMIEDLSNVADSRVDFSKDSVRDSKKVFLINDEKRLITGSSIHAYIKISEGCNQKCSFCAIPSFKGRLQSRSIESCVSEIERLVGLGFRDFSFIAQDSSSYMRDLGKNNALIDLIKSVEKISGIKSARILYLYPTTLTHSVIEAIAESSIFQNYFDMPLQHISDSMLSLMRRGVRKSKQIELLELMRECENSFIRTTFLLGHPGESERDIEELCEFVEDFVFDRVNIFAFSSEEGTKAHEMQPKIPQKTTNERINRLNKIIQKQQKNIFKSYENTMIKGIIDGESKDSALLFSARDLRWDREIDGEILINENLTQTPLVPGYYEIKIESCINEKNQRYLIGKAIKRL